MLPPLPRCSGRAYSSLKNHPSVSAFPDSTIGSACTSSFSRFARRSLALRPAHSRSHLGDRYPRASDISSPPCLPRLLPAGANRRVGLAPTGKRRLVTAHTLNSHCGNPRFPTPAYPIEQAFPRPTRFNAVERRLFPVGASPTRQPLQPEATGAVMEVTKWLKPLVNVSRFTVTARVCRPQRE